MDTHAGMRVVGRLKGTPWERFVKLQRRAAKVSAGSYLQPRGVFCFSSHEEANEWTLQNRIYRAAYLHGLKKQGK
jgi:hypothetical protein